MLAGIEHVQKHVPMLVMIKHGGCRKKVKPTACKQLIKEEVLFKHLIACKRLYAPQRSHYGILPNNQMIKMALAFEACKVHKNKLLAQVVRAKMGGGSCMGVS